jgi:hypothetical protein
MLCPYCKSQVKADGSCSCHPQGKSTSSAPEIRTAGVEGPRAAVQTERLPFRGLELPIP